MEFDDSSEKLRRNLVVFSFGYLVSVYLGVSLIEVLKLAALGSLADSLSQAKVTSILLIILIYLCFRWFTSKEYLELSNSFFTGWGCRYSEMLRVHLDANVRSLSEKTPNWIKISNADLERIRAFYENSKKATLLSGYTLTVVSGSKDADYVAGKGTMHLHLHKMLGKNASVTAEYQFDIPMVQKILFQLRIFWRALKEQQMFEILPPILLSLVAEYLVVFRLTSGLLSR